MPVEARIGEGREPKITYELKKITESPILPDEKNKPLLPFPPLLRSLSLSLFRPRLEIVRSRLNKWSFEKVLKLVPRVCLGPLGTLGRGPSAEITRRLFSAINVAGTAVSDRDVERGWDGKIF